MTFIRKLAAMGYPSKVSRIETRTQDGRSERFELTGSLDVILRIAKRIAPESLKKLKALGQRSEMRLVMRFGVSPAKDEYLVFCAGQLRAEDKALLSRLRDAVEQDVAAIFAGNLRDDQQTDLRPRDRRKPQHRLGYERGV